MEVEMAKAIIVAVLAAIAGGVLTVVVLKSLGFAASSEVGGGVGGAVGGIVSALMLKQTSSTG
jgi:hypothetical protein